MRFAIECSIDSLMLIEKEFHLQLGDAEYYLIPNKNGFISSIKITKKVDNPEKFYSEVLSGTGGSKLTINIRAEKEFVEKLRSEMQYLEASLSFDGPHTQIHWESPKQEWIPENDEEKSKLKIFKIEFKKEYPVKPKILTEEIFYSIIINRNNYDELTVLKAFYNDGIKFFKEFKYINAFYNFYFIIEDIYGGANTQNRLIIKSYKESENLKEHIKWIMDNYIKNNERHHTKLKEFLKDMGKTDSIEDIIEFLVLTRGRLHHFSRKSTLKIGTPLNQSDYESVAFLAMGIALRALLNEILEINKTIGIAK